MKKVILFILIFILSFSLKAQRNAEFGAIAGLSYYMGDLNPSKHFYNPKFTYGFLYRYNFNESYSIRASLINSSIQASDADFSNSYQKERNASFSTSFMAYSIMGEFNFYPFWLPKENWSHSFVPYVSLGLSYVEPENKGTVAIPMGIGFKYLLYGNFTLGIEWTFLKNFADDIDQRADPIKTQSESVLINNDWISYIGVSITYRLFKDNTCSMYNKIRGNGIKS